MKIKKTSKKSVDFFIALIATSITTYGCANHNLGTDRNGYYIQPTEVRQETIYTPTNGHVYEEAGEYTPSYQKVGEEVRKQEKRRASEAKKTEIEITPATVDYSAK